MAGHTHRAGAHDVGSDSDEYLVFGSVGASVSTLETRQVVQIWDTIEQLCFIRAEQSRQHRCLTTKNGDRGSQSMTVEDRNAVDTGSVDRFNFEVYGQPYFAIIHDRRGYLEGYTEVLKLNLRHGSCAGRAAILGDECAADTGCRKLGCYRITRRSR